MWKVSPKTPHTQFLCRFQFYKLPLKTNRESFFGILEKENLSKQKKFWREKNQLSKKDF
jgi:hypothetical protein